MGLDEFCDKWLHLINRRRQFLERDWRTFGGLVLKKLLEGFSKRFDLRRQILDSLSAWPERSLKVHHV
jgi:hypothetical protein